MDVSEFAKQNPTTERTEPAECKTHGEYLSRVTEVLGRTFRLGCPTCYSEREAEKARIEKIESDKRSAARRDSDLQKTGVALRFRDRTLASYRAETPKQKAALSACLQMVDQIVSGAAKTPNLIFCGRPGTGKTHLATGIAIALLDARFHALKINAADMVRAVRSTWSRDSERSEDQVLDDFANRSLLIIDEIGVQTGSDNEKLIMFEVINRRYEACRPTLLISNLSPDQIKAELGDRVMDRLREDGGRMIAFDWESERRGAA